MKVFRLASKRIFLTLPEELRRKNLGERDSNRKEIMKPIVLTLPGCLRRKNVRQRDLKRK